MPAKITLNIGGGNFGGDDQEGESSYRSKKNDFVAVKKEKKAKPEKSKFA